VENLRVPTANGDLSVTISVGVVTYPDYEMETSEEMIACADAALYQAKQTGRNKTCVFTAEMAEDS
jgi:diguanylate cyclase (GGDEF)-like protein